MLARFCGDRGEAICVAPSLCRPSKAKAGRNVFYCFTTFNNRRLTLESDEINVRTRVGTRRRYLVPVQKQSPPVRCPAKSAGKPQKKKRKALSTSWRGFHRTGPSGGRSCLWRAGAESSSAGAADRGTAGGTRGLGQPPSTGWAAAERADESGRAVLLRQRGGRARALTQAGGAGAGAAAVGSPHAHFAAAWEPSQKPFGDAVLPQPHAFLAWDPAPRSGSGGL